MNATNKLAVLILLALALPTFAQAEADWRSWPTGDRFRMGLAYFSPKLDTAVLVTDATGTVGTGISFERNLGLDEKKGTAIVDASWRFFKRHSLSLNYFDLRRSARTNTSVSIGIGGELIDIDLPIESFFDIKTYEIAYSYSLLFDEKKELRIGAGLSLQNLELGIQGTELSPNPGDTVVSILSSTAPLPTLNVGFNYAFNNRWIFESNFGWLAVDLEFDTSTKLSGRIFNGYAGVRWDAFQNASFFARYQLFDVNVEYRPGAAIFSVNYSYKGPAIGVSVGF